jgi:hypothetical protein
MRVVVDKPLVGHWMARELNCTFDPNRMTSIGVFDTEKNCLVAGVYYERFTGYNIFMHQVMQPGGTTKDFFWYAFYYPFVELGCSRVTGMLPEENEKALRVALKLGFKEEARIAGASRAGKDVIILRMLKEECRWLVRGKRK